MCGCVVVNIQKQTDSASRLENLISRFDADFSRSFLMLINAIKDDLILTDLATLIEAGQIEEAINVIETQLSRFSGVIISGIVASGQDTAEFINDVLRVVVSFDQTNFRAVDEMRNARLRLISGLTSVQRDAIRETLVEGIRTGLNPLDQARGVIRSIGLTARQVQTVNTFRRLLQEGSAEALRRELRDRRFDPLIRRAIAGEALTQDQIDRMVQRYSERLLAFRARTIARTESLRAVHQGNELMYAQAVESGVLDPTRLVREWLTSRDSRVRDSHDGMNGQKQLFGQPFISDVGNRLRYPGDPGAPASETIQCRCVAVTTLLPLGESL